MVLSSRVESMQERLWSSRAGCQQALRALESDWQYDQ
jgi:hypothetical protein